MKQILVITLAIWSLCAVSLAQAAQRDGRELSQKALERLQSQQDAKLRVFWDDAQTTPRRVAAFRWETSEDTMESTVLDCRDARSTIS